MQNSPRPDAGGDHDAQPELHPEVAAFARWFVDWWLRRGAHLVAEEETKRAA
jgi:hypothetical protein